MPEYPKHQSLGYHLCDFCYSPEPPENSAQHCLFKLTIIFLKSTKKNDNENK